MTIQTLANFSTPLVYYSDNDDDAFDRTHVANIAINLDALDGTPGHGVPYKRLAGDVQIQDAGVNHHYRLAVADLAADRTVTLPLLTANDAFVFENHPQTLTQKTLTSPVLNTPTINNPTITGDLVLPGNLGLGGDALAAWSGRTVLAFDARNAVDSVPTGGINLVNNGYFDGAWKYAQTAAATLLTMNVGAFTFNNAVSGTAGTALSWVERMRIDAAGVVGIAGIPPAWGTAGPVSVLDFLAGGAALRTSASTIGVCQNLWHDGTNWKNTSNAPLSLYFQTAGRHQFYGQTSPGAAGTSVTMQLRCQIDVDGATQFNCYGTSINAFTVRNSNPTSNTTFVVWNDASKYVYLVSYGSSFVGNSSMTQAAAANTGELVANQQLAIGTVVASHVFFCSNATSRVVLNGSNGHFYPVVTNTYDCGVNGGGWRDVWCVRAAFNGSHSSLKRDWREIGGAEALAVARATPVGTFRYKPTSDDDPVADWTRVGILADHAHPWLSPDGRNVNAQDTACLSLAAIQALAARIEQLEARLQEVA